ncbi:protein of unknown function (plasmid) [Caballeronia sp. S22]
MTRVSLGSLDIWHFRRYAKYASHARTSGLVKAERLARHRP